MLYEELRSLAQAYLARERPDHTLQPTALVHEAYIRLLGKEGLHYRGRAQFFSLMSKVMRQVLVDHGKARRAAKRGGGHSRVVLDDVVSLFGAPSIDIVALDEALSKLDQLDPQQGRIVELRFFGGLTIKEIADLLGVSQSTVERDWRLARAWLRCQMDPT